MKRRDKEIAYGYIFAGLLLINGVINENGYFKILFFIASGLMFLCECYNVIKRKK